ncbi:MAG: hypothetical protein ACR2GN_05680 [Bacteroidia bacterium]
MLKRIKSSLIVFLLIQTLVVKAQTTENISPYSRYGIGEINYSGFTPSLSMGGTGIGFTAHNMVNILNPASYSDLNLVSFAAGIHSDFYRYSTENNSSTGNYTNLSYLNLAFPLRKDTTWGLSFGLIPFSNVGYNIATSDSITGVDLVSRSYQGSGGFNQVYIGTGFKIGKRISLGANVGYIFGNIDKIRRLEFEEANTINTQVSNNISISDINVNAAAQLRLITREKSGLILGLTAGLPKDMSATRNFVALRYADNGSIIDTAYVRENESGSITLPLSLGAGIMYKKQNVWKERDVLNLGVDYFMQDWSTFEAFAISDSLRNSYRVSLGAQYLPDESMQAGYMERVYYRFGVRYHQTYLEINETALQEYGITFGLGLPMKPFGLNRAPSYINIGVELGQRGTKENNLIQEQFARILIGFTLNDNSWFRKRRYD